MRKKRILIVDDEPMILASLEQFLAGMDYEIASYGEPDTCPIYSNNVECCPNDEPCSDIVILDLKMPRMNGIQLFEKQKQRGCKIDTRNKTIISGYPPTNNHSDQVKELGCSYLEKPFIVSELLKWVDECNKRIDTSQSLRSL